MYFKDYFRDKLFYEMRGLSFNVVRFYFLFFFDKILSSFFKYVFFKLFRLFIKMIDFWFLFLVNLS